jgi:hypothetical protein
MLAAETAIYANPRLLSGSLRCYKCRRAHGAPVRSCPGATPGMTEALLFTSVGSLLTVGAAILIIAALTLQNARRYVELTEARMEHLREEHARLMAFLREERQSLKEGLEQKREQHLQTQRRAEPASRGRMPPQQAQRLSVEELDRERESHLEALQERGTRESEPRTRPDVERRIDELKRELREFQQAREIGPKIPSPLLEGSLEDMLATTSKPAEEDKKPRLAVWHPHPDDDISGGRRVLQAPL